MAATDEANITDEHIHAFTGEVVSEANKGNEEEEKEEDEAGESVELPMTNNEYGPFPKLAASDTAVNQAAPAESSPCNSVLPVTLPICGPTHEVEPRLDALFNGSATPLQLTHSEYLAYEQSRAAEQA